MDNPHPYAQLTSMREARSRMRVNPGLYALSSRRRILYALLGTPLLANCATRRLDAVPKELTQNATIPDIPNARYWADSDYKPFLQEAENALQREKQFFKLRDEELPPANFLAISGGGDNGAFGSGLLNGWSVEGTRPVFKAVTGISTGALMGPFVFLGTNFDPELKAIYTSVSSKDIFRRRGLLAAFFNDALSD